MRRLRAIILICLLGIPLTFIFSFYSHKSEKHSIDGYFTPCFHNDFQLNSLGEFAEQIERYVQAAIGANIRESI
jgi:hypothetical protein